MDSLVGSNHAGRNWWDLQHYTIDIETDIDNKRLSGIVSIKYKVIGSGHVMMIDLQAPMQITKVTSSGKIIPFKQQGRFWWIDKNSEGKVGKIDSIMIEYNGSPKVASNPPWDGGLIWNKDEKGRPYVGTACQGDGASLWWPCKEIQSDEPDMGVDLFFQAPKDLTVVSNGRLLSSTDVDPGKKRWHWRVTQPINNYNVTMNIGQYEKIAEIYEGKKGPLDVSFYVLDYNLEKGMELFPEIKLMLECFESRIGPYPFYEDGYKMIETSFWAWSIKVGLLMAINSKEDIQAEIEVIPDMDYCGILSLSMSPVTNGLVIALLQKILMTAGSTKVLRLTWKQFILNVFQEKKQQKNMSSVKERSLQTKSL
ncbi:MAG: hypothetical protein IPP89_18090 [Saprospiraceae bacterium]|nr:hypothetical protein [Candidatus Brachybacter algidus]